MAQNTQQKSGVKSNIVLITIGIVLFAFFFTSLPAYLASFIPESWLKNILSEHIQVVTLHEGDILLSEPLKLDSDEPLNILGRKSGICLYFKPTVEDPTMENILPPKTITKAQQARPIAEIIGVTAQKQEFQLEYSEYMEQNESDASPFYVICQRFSKSHSLIPETFEAIYVRPFKPFTMPYKVTWETVKDF